MKVLHKLGINPLHHLLSKLKCEKAFAFYFPYIFISFMKLWLGALCFHFINAKVYTLAGFVDKSVSLSVIILMELVKCLGSK